MSSQIPFAVWPLQYVVHAPGATFATLGTPQLLRLVHGTADLLDKLRHITNNGAFSSYNEILRGDSIVFAMSVDASGRWPDTLVQISLTNENTGAPRGMEGESYWYVSRFSTRWNWPILKELRTIPPSVNADPDEPVDMMAQIRARLLWLLFDLLEFGPGDLDVDVQRELMVPNVTTLPADAYIRMLRAPLNIHLADLVKEHRHQHHLLTLTQEALTTYQIKTGPGEEYEQLVGAFPSEPGLMTLLNRVHDLRKMVFEVSGELCKFFYGGTSNIEDVKTLVSPYRRDRLGGVHKDMFIHVQPEEGELGWTLWSGRPLCGDPVGASTEGPIQLMHQAGLELYSMEQFNKWLEANVDPGALLYDDEPYDLLDEQPLIWPNEKFKKWALGGGIGNSR